MVTYFLILTNVFNSGQYASDLTEHYAHPYQVDLFKKNGNNERQYSLKWFPLCPLSLETPCSAGKYTYVANWFSFHLTCAI